jgi:nucleoside 2-deoxyribosyltransferase
MKIYLASPFFNPEQIEVLMILEAEAERLGYDVFSPRIKCYCSPYASEEKRKESFHSNCRGIIEADVVLARIDDFDPGTIWELGFSYGVKNLMVPPKIYAYTTVPQRGLNLMLAQGVDGFLQGVPSILKFLKEMKEENSDREAKKWKSQIV